MGFPEHFLWGAASSAYQIEGAAHDDGKGLSIWDAFSHTEGRVWKGQTADIACDHYHRYAEDVSLMQAIGLQAYRFSVCWPRVLPEGTGRVNDAGIAFYDRLVDALLSANITPFITLFHWDFPLTLYHRGGWLNRDVADWFADYAALMVSKLGDRVTRWITLNEPAAVAGAGHYWGVHAPGVRYGLKETLQVAHHTLLAHGKAVQAIRAAAPVPCQVGSAFDLRLFIPVSSREEDIRAAEHFTFNIYDTNPQANSIWLDTAIHGVYPEQAAKHFGKHLPRISAEDIQIIHQPLDFLGVNIYHGEFVRAGADGQPEIAPFDPSQVYYGPWHMTPSALYWGPRMLWERYQLPIIITENGIPCQDWVLLDGAIHDAARQDFMHRYLINLHQAIGEGVDVRGYFYWSIMDNFEWQSGTQHRFGLIHIDYATQKRTLKDSAYWYKQVIETHGMLLLDGVTSAAGHSVA